MEYNTVRRKMNYNYTKQPDESHERNVEKRIQPQKSMYCMISFT